MATAIETSSQPQPHAPSPPANLIAASLIGAVYVLAALAVVFYAVPAIWAQSIAPSLKGLGEIGTGLRATLQIAAAAGLVWFGHSLTGTNPPKGLRGGVFLVIVAAALIFFLARAAGLAIEGTGGMVFSALVVGGLGFLAFRLFTSPRGERWMIGLEEQGWFSAAPYKRALGQRVRRLTILGILLLGGSGVYTLINQGLIPEKDWTITLPFTQRADAPEGTLQTFTLLTDTNYSLPLLLIGLTLWIAYRAVNMPAFAEFLIATEAEMNKVSWSTRKRLVQDTIVVLITTILMALFLLVVDLFWGWLLSRQTVGVLPGKSTANEKAGQTQAAKW